MTKNMTIKPNVSLATKAAIVLREFIIENYKDGGKIPGEIDLSKQLGVNRSTIRQALRTLEHEGLVIRRQGDGTYSNAHVIGITTRIDDFIEYQEVIRQAGYEPSTKQIEVFEKMCPEDIAKKIDIPTESPLLVSRNLLFADGNPAIYVEDMIPMALIREEYDQQELEASIFGFLEERCYKRMSYTISEILPRICGDELSKHLGLEPWQALIETKGVVFSEANHPIMFSKSYYREPFIRFSVIRKKINS